MAYYLFCFVQIVFRNHKDIIEYICSPPPMDIMDAI